MRTIAIILTVFNRKRKTLSCLDTIHWAMTNKRIPFQISVFLTDDGSTDGTTEAILERNYPFPLRISHGNGSLFWNRGMILSWQTAISCPESFDGYLWINNDIEILPDFWEMLSKVDDYAVSRYGSGQIYIGSTKDKTTGVFTYGGFNFVNLLTLKDQMLPPNGDYQECQCGHGNITYVSNEVVEKMGIFSDEYGHGGSDHDYTYRAHKKGFHLIILPEYAALCQNDHPADGGRDVFESKTLRERFKEVFSPRGNLHNSLLFQKRCFPWRYPIVLATGSFKALFPRAYHALYLYFRNAK